MFTSAQKKTTTDSSGKLLDEVIITATRTENKVSNIPMPVQVISSKNIQLSGSQKLIDILQMQAGLVIANNPLGTALQGYPNPFGDGIQMQGLDPAYTLILVDGEPLIGRNAGIINLGRIAIGDIRQIEILKGPATSLYGSDALAGVINIITQEPAKNTLNLQAHYATNNTLGLTASSSIKSKKTSLQLFLNRYSSDGYDLDKNIYGKTVDPFIDYTVNAKFSYNIDAKNKFSLSARYFSDKQFNSYLIFPDQQAQVVKGNTIENDKSLFASFQHIINNKVNYSSSVYATNYTNNAAVYLQKNDSLYEKIMLSQFLLRPEVQVNIGKNPASLLVTGAGYNFETVNSSRYSSLKELKSWYLFVQKQFQFNQKTNIITGARLDKNSLYRAELSPKLAIAYKLSPDFIFKGSIGAGFKAPDFRQQFLNFSNSLIGYTLLGARELGHGLQMLQRNGEIDQSININPYLNGNELIPEKSIGINAGFDYSLSENSSIKINFFRNDISNLIETYNLPFNKTNNQAIYSYINLNKVFTEGMEASFSYIFNKNFTLSGGYQYLVAKDKEVLAQIKEGKLYKRDPITNVTTLVTKSDYKGLYNRSRNTANLRLQYNNILYRSSVFITAKYRGRYGFSGLNNFSDGNNVLDDDREFVKSFQLLNATITKQIASRWQLQAGVENLLNYTNKLVMPNIFGRIYFINCNYKL
ncbi:MAG: TonB-dependent receptor [Bacteroidota bacterium]|nr:TonB-dependent receptor [Bacteroidota bacterium]